MMGELILRNLLHRPVRTLIGAMGIAVEVALVVLIVGLTSGLLTETARRIEGIGADIMLQPPSSRSEEHTSELQSQSNLVCRLLLEKKKNNKSNNKCTYETTGRL